MWRYINGCKYETLNAQGRISVGCQFVNQAPKVNFVIIVAYFIRTVHIKWVSLCFGCSKLNKVNVHTYAPMGNCYWVSIFQYLPIILHPWWPASLHPQTENDLKIDHPSLEPSSKHFTILMSSWQNPNVSDAEILTAINAGLDQMLPQPSEAISGQGILIGRIHRLYLHSPSSLNCTIDLGLGHGGLASR